MQTIYFPVVSQVFQVYANGILLVEYYVTNLQSFHWLSLAKYFSSSLTLLQFNYVFIHIGTIIGTLYFTVMCQEQHL